MIKMRKDYTYIQRIAEYGGLTKAADELFVSVPALSRFVKNKEKELGVKLFQRNGKTFQLTYAGQKYLETEEQIQTLWRNFDNSVQNHTQGLKTTLKIGFPLSLGKILISKIIPRFEKKYPRISLYAYEDKVVVLNRLLLQGKLDLIFTMKEFENKDTSNIDIFPIVSGQICLIAPERTSTVVETNYRPSFSYPWLKPKTINKLPLIGLRQHSFFREHIKKYLLTTIAQEPNIQITLSTIEHVLLAVDSNIGWTPMVDFLVYLSGLKHLKLYSFGSQPYQMNLVIACNKGITDSSANLEFINLCINKIRKEVHKNGIKSN